MEAYTCNPSTQEGEAQRSEVQNHLWLHREFKAILGYIKLSLNKIK